jgi:hypothetical protein
MGLRQGAAHHLTNLFRLLSAGARVDDHNCRRSGEDIGIRRHDAGLRNDREDFDGGGTRDLLPDVCFDLHASLTSHVWPLSVRHAGSEVDVDE